jgi:superfamily I DNA/RNA helicase
LGLGDLAVASCALSAIQSRTSFYGWEEFLRAVGADDGQARGECTSALEELSSSIQRGSEDSSSPLLSVEEYFALGNRRALTFLYERRAIHSIADFYQERLCRTGGWDEIDLSKAALRRLEGGTGESAWDLVVCDEFQDLTDVQTALLFRLAADPRAVVLTGDPRQIINPSGFRWEEAKNKFYARGLPVMDVHRLSLNFRCVGSIVRLANALLDIKADLARGADAVDMDLAGWTPLM